MIRYDMAWYGMAQYGMPWYGVTWYGMVWHGIYRLVFHGICVYIGCGCPSTFMLCVDAGLDK